MSASPIERLLGAIEQLISAEAIALQSENLAAVTDVQRRTGGVIARLAQLLRESGTTARRPAELAERIHRLQERRRRNLELLLTIKAQRQEAWARIESARQVLKKLKPAYGKTQRARFSAAG